MVVVETSERPNTRMNIDVFEMNICVVCFCWK